MAFLGSFHNERADEQFTEEKKARAARRAGGGGMYVGGACMPKIR